MAPSLNLPSMSDADLFRLRLQINNVLSHRRADARERLERLNAIRPEWVDKIIRDVAAEREQAVRDITGFRRDRPICSARWEVWRRIYAQGRSTCRIACWFRRDPTTVRHALIEMGAIQPKKRAA